MMHTYVSHRKYNAHLCHIIIRMHTCVSHHYHYAHLFHIIACITHTRKLYIISHHIISYHISYRISYHISYHIISYYIILYYILTLFFKLLIYRITFTDFYVIFACWRQSPDSVATCCETYRYQHHVLRVDRKKIYHLIHCNLSLYVFIFIPLCLWVSNNTWPETESPCGINKKHYKTEDCVGDILFFLIFILGLNGVTCLRDCAFVTIKRADNTERVHF